MKPNTLLQRTVLQSAVRVHPYAWGETRSAQRHGVRLLCLESRPAVPLLSSTCPRHVQQHTLAGELRWQCADCVVGTWIGALEKELPTTLQIGHARDCVPQSLNDPRLQELPGELCTADGSSQDLDAFRLPNLGTKLVGGTPPRFHTLVFPWCKRMPATRNRHSANVS